MYTGDNVTKFYITIKFVLKTKILKKMKSPENKGVISPTRV
jgi:hypothetical protein